MQQVTQQTAANAEEGAAASEELSAQLRQCKPSSLSPGRISALPASIPCNRFLDQNDHVHAFLVLHFSLECTPEQGVSVGGRSNLYRTHASAS